MNGVPILSLVTFLPLVGAAFILLLRGEEAVVARNARWVALWTSVVTFAVSLALWTNFDNTTPDFQFVEKAPWIPALNVTYHLGIDGISLFFVLLSTFITPVCILAAWESVKSSVKEFMICFLVLETMMVGMFSALDLVLFYVFIEGVLIPMFIVIGVWGGTRRVYAAFKFFLYTLVGSVLLLVAIIAIHFDAGTTDLPQLYSHSFSRTLQLWLWLAFFASFAIKVPMWPLHTWLPDAHVEAPTAASVVLAGILIKMGGYGFLRFSVPLLPEASLYFRPLIYILSIIAVIYTSLIALVQADMKKLVAYSSVGAHMGFVTIGIFTLNIQGVEGSVVQMLSHGVISGALFILVGVLHDRMHSYEIAKYGGLVHRMPVYAVVFMFFAMGSVGLPGTSGFIGEFLVLLGSAQANTLVAYLGTVAIIVTPCYMLWLYRRVIFGALTKESLKAITDLTPRELAILLPLGAIVLWMGIYPKPFLDAMHVSVANFTHQVNSRLGVASVPLARGGLSVVSR